MPIGYWKARIEYLGRGQMIRSAGQGCGGSFGEIMIVIISYGYEGTDNDPQANGTGARTCQRPAADGFGNGSAEWRPSKLCNLIEQKRRKLPFRYVIWVIVSCLGIQQPGCMDIPAEIWATRGRRSAIRCSTLPVPLFWVECGAVFN